MAYTYISPVNNLRHLYQYLNGAPHNGHEQRNLAIDGINLLPESVERFDNQILHTFRHAKKECKHAAYSMIVSFSRKEYDPENVDDVMKARELLQIVLPKMFPDRQIAVYLQADGGSYMREPCLHAHCMISNVGLSSGRSLDKNRRFTDLVKSFNELCITEGKSLITLDFGRNYKAKDRESAFVRGIHLRQKDNPNRFVLNDEFKEVLKAGMSIATSREELKVMLNRVGYDIEYRTEDINMRTDPKRGASRDYGDYYLIRLKDLALIPDGEKIPRNLAAKSYKLGTAYSLQEVDKSIERNRQAETMISREEFIKECKAEFNEIENGTGFMDEIVPQTTEHTGHIMTEDRDEDRAVDSDNQAEIDSNTTKKNNTAYDRLLDILSDEDNDWTDNDTFDGNISEALMRTAGSRKLAKLLKKESKDIYENETYSNNQITE